LVFSGLVAGDHGRENRAGARTVTAPAAIVSSGMAGPSGIYWLGAWAWVKDWGLSIEAGARTIRAAVAAGAGARAIGPAGWLGLQQSGGWRWNWGWGSG
jgi:hypothetical protein